MNIIEQQESIATKTRRNTKLNGYTAYAINEYEQQIFLDNWETFRYTIVGNVYRDDIITSGTIKEWKELKDDTGNIIIDKLVKIEDKYPNFNIFYGSNEAPPDWGVAIGIPFGTPAKVLSQEQYEFRTKEYYDNLDDCLKSLDAFLGSYFILIARNR